VLPEEIRRIHDDKVEEYPRGTLRKCDFRIRNPQRSEDSNSGSDFDVTVPQAGGGF